MMLGGYVEALLSHMGLPHWRVEIVWDEPPSDPDAIASMQVIEGRWLARLRLRPGLLDEPSGEVRDTIVHELVHLHLALVQKAIDTDAALLGAPHIADQVWEAGARRGLEHGVDGIARAWGLTLPLPPVVER